MFSSIATKIALKKAGISSNALDFSNEPCKDKYQSQSQSEDTNWSNWLSYKSLPLTVHPWFSPPPPAASVRRIPRIGDTAPQDADRKLIVPRGQRVLVVFLRCVGCAFAQKTFLNLRTLANRHRQSITFIAVSHSSEAATRKWIDMLGGAWNVQVIIDQDRAIYAAWGLGTANMWHLFNPTTQVQGWKEKGWLGEKVAESIQRKATFQSRSELASGKPAGTPDEEEDGFSTAMGNKWQESGAFAVDGRGTVVWGGKAMRADDVMDLDEGIKLLVL